MIVLGIETSCDETAVGIVRRTANGDGEIMADIVRSQIAEHAPYGGVVPEIAARAHVEVLDGLLERAMQQAGLPLSRIDGFAATAGPGLLGGVIVGLVAAKALAASTDKPLLAINHLEGHALTPRLTHNVSFPFLLLLVSGGHTQILIVEGVGRYRRLATTIDDALGEAFDKTAKLLGLGYPGGPSVEAHALGGRGDAIAFPRPMVGRAEPHFSFSGLKTAVRLEAIKRAPLSEADIADICASFQAAVADSVADRLKRAFDVFSEAYPDVEPVLAIAGGVAANKALSARLQAVAAAKRARLVVPSPRLCTDNGVMIAWAGAERLALGLTDNMGFQARARWPLDPDAEAVRGAGVKA